VQFSVAGSAAFAATQTLFRAESMLGFAIFSLQKVSALNNNAQHAIACGNGWTAKAALCLPLA
jgi:hypothetical protein